MRILLLAVGLAAVFPTTATASPGELRRIEGEVVETRSRWGHGGRTIVTESLVRAADGEELRVQQLGGSVDGLAMVVRHAPPVLRRGERLGVEAVERTTRSGAAVWSVERLFAARDDDGVVLPFVRTRSKLTDVPIEWASGCALLTLDEDGTSHISGDQEFSVMSSVVDRWNADTAACSYFDLRIDDIADHEVGFDGINLILFREDDWCRPATEEDPEECYNPAAAGLTTLFFVDDPKSDRNGEIVDADIELNAVHFAFSVEGETTQPGGRCEAELGNTLTHEIGHLLGLDHTCWVANGGGPQLDDDQGTPVPRCDATDLPNEILDATMYNFQTCGETKKATPEADDIDGVCAIYPLERDPGVCVPPNLDVGGCCSVAGESSAPILPRGAALLFLLGTFALLLRRRRQQL